MRLNTHMGVARFACLLGVLPAIIACQRSSAPERTVENVAAAPSTTAATPPHPGPVTEAKPDRAAASPAGNPHAATELGITWSDPPGWERVATKSAMRAAEYRVKAVEGDSEPAEVTVFYFGASMGGGVDDNLNRWAQQFREVKESDVKRTTRQDKGFTHHLIHIPSGEYAGMSMMGGASPAKANYGLLGAVTETPSGKYFFKMTGPSKTVAANQGAFDALLESVQNK